ASKTPNPLVNPKLIPTIFAYIDDLIKLSNELVKSMRFSPFPSSNNLQYILEFIKNMQKIIEKAGMLSRKQIKMFYIENLFR
ncbi:19691_t:CDS:1, partial [Entrophospora sp. SA101]